MGECDNLSFTYGDMEMEIVPNYTYLGIVFTSGGSLNITLKTLSDQALKAIFILNKYLTKSDKLISPILCYGSEGLIRKRYLKSSSSVL